MSVVGAFYQCTYPMQSSSPILNIRLLIIELSTPIIDGTHLDHVQWPLSTVLSRNDFNNQTMVGVGLKAQLLTGSQFRP